MSQKSDHKLKRRPPGEKDDGETQDADWGFDSDETDPGLEKKLGLALVVCLLLGFGFVFYQKFRILRSDSDSSQQASAEDVTESPQEPDLGESMVVGSAADEPGSNPHPGPVGDAAERSGQLEDDDSDNVVSKGGPMESPFYEAAEAVADGSSDAASGQADDEGAKENWMLTQSDVSEESPASSNPDALPPRPDDSEAPFDPFAEEEESPSGSPSPAMETEAGASPLFDWDEPEDTPPPAQSEPNPDSLSEQDPPAGATPPTTRDEASPFAIEPAQTPVPDDGVPSDPAPEADEPQMMIFGDDEEPNASHQLPAMEFEEPLPAQSEPAPADTADSVFSEATESETDVSEIDGPETDMSEDETSGDEDSGIAVSGPDAAITEPDVFGRPPSEPAADESPAADAGSGPFDPFGVGGETLQETGDDEVPDEPTAVDEPMPADEPFAFPTADPENLAPRSEGPDDLPRPSPAEAPETPPAADTDDPGPSGIVEPPAWPFGDSSATGQDSTTTENDASPATDPVTDQPSPAMTFEPPTSEPTPTTDAPQPSWPADDGGGSNPFSIPGTTSEVGITREGGTTSGLIINPGVEAQPVVGERELTVTPNDSFWSISGREYGSTKYYSALARYNQERVSKPELLQSGMKIAIPPPEVLESRFPELFHSGTSAEKISPMSGSSPAAAEPGLFLDDRQRPRYRVGKEDTLSSIAQRHLGRSSRWTEIYDLNRDQLKSPSTLTIGMELKLPPDAGGLQVSPAGGLNR